MLNKVLFSSFVLLLMASNNQLFADHNNDVSDKGFSKKLIAAAQERTRHQVTYSGQYLSIAYPNGDVPNHIGVCTDLVIRSYRKVGIDLQKLVHEDMRDHFALYPNNWGLKRPDSNIDHRRVPNLQVFFKRFGQSLPVTKESKDYLPGDLVTWMLGGSLPHIGIVSDKKSSDGSRYLILHNIGSGPQEEDFLFGAEITGHYRFYGKSITL